MSDIDYLPKMENATFYRIKVEDMDKDDLLRVIKFLSDEMIRYREDSEEFSRYKVAEMSRTVKDMRGYKTLNGSN